MFSVKKNGLILAVTGILTVLTFVYSAARFRNVTIRQPKPNILILSLCSVRQDHMSAYGYERPTTPNLAEFARQSFVFRNTFSSMSWTNSLTYLGLLTPQFVAVEGYSSPGIYGGYMRIPKERGLELEYKAEFDYLKQLLLTPQIRPFYLEVHVKYQHFPYIDFLNRDARSPENGFFLSARSKELLGKYLADPKKYPEKLPMLTLLLRDRDLILAHPLVQQWAREGKAAFDPNEPFGILNNPRLLDAWKKSPGYEDDLNLLKEAYDSKLRFFDSILKDVLNLYDDEDLKKNTIVIVTGDHGEGFMDHGYLLHGETVADEVIRLPLMVRFPDTDLKSPVFLDRQFYQGNIFRMVLGFLRGYLSSGNMAVFADTAEPTNDAIVSRNCNGNLRSVRFENRWKLVTDIATRERWLYDLKNDPGETHDLYANQPETAGRLEELLSRHYDMTLNSQETSCMGHGVE